MADEQEADQGGIEIDEGGVTMWQGCVAKNPVPPETDAKDGGCAKPQSKCARSEIVDADKSKGRRNRMTISNGVNSTSSVTGQSDA
jgi:hypothetical protein